MAFLIPGYSHTAKPKMDFSLKWFHLSYDAAFFSLSLFRSLLAGHKHNSIAQLWSKQEQVSKAAADGMRLCSIEFRFSELVKNEKSWAQDWSAVSAWQKQIDWQSRWIQSRLIRRIPRDGIALPNTAHPLLLNPTKSQHKAVVSHKATKAHTRPGKRGNTTKHPAHHTMEITCWNHVKGLSHERSVTAFLADFKCNFLLLSSWCPSCSGLNYCPGL